MVVVVVYMYCIIHGFLDVGVSGEDLLSKLPMVVPVWFPFGLFRFRMLRWVPMYSFLQRHLGRKDKNVQYLYEDKCEYPCVEYE